MSGSTIEIPGITTGASSDVVDGRLTYVDTTTIKWAFVNSNQIRLWNNTAGDHVIVECAAEPTLSSTANDINGDAVAYATVYDVFGKYGSATSITLQAAKWAVSTAGSSARTAAWVTSTAYKIGQRVSNGGSYYPCLEAHTSGTFATDLAAGKWGPAMTGTGDLLGLDVLDGSGVYSNTGAWRGYRYLGAIITYNDTGSKFRNTTTCSSIANYYNADEVYLITYNSTASPWGYSTAAVRDKNNGTGSVKAQFLTVKTQALLGGISGSAYGATGAAGGAFLYVDETYTASMTFWTSQTSRTNTFSPCGNIIIAPGFHQAVEKEYATGATLYLYGTDGTYQDQGWIKAKA